MNHQLLSQSLGNVSLGLPQAFGNLTVFPLCRLGAGSADYLTLAEALRRNLAEVREVSLEGKVTSLSFLNQADMPILLLEGEELAGARQNRVLSLTVLVPAKTTLTIPVACVEARRWEYRRPDFEVSGMVLHARARAAMAASVSESLASNGARTSDQGQLWHEIERKAQCMNVQPETLALADVFRARADSLAWLRRRLRPTAGQVGAAFCINGMVEGLELFDAPETLDAHLVKLIDSYSLDALELPPSETQPAAALQVKDLLKRICATEVQSYPAIGLGEDLRLRGEEVQGTALVAQGRLVHLSAHVVLRHDQSAGSFDSMPMSA
jgi:hypothetical protein